MVDQLLSTGGRLQAVADELTAWLPEGITAYPDQPPADGPTPFVLVTGGITARRTDLTGHWTMANLEIGTWSVHDTLGQARALADLVRTWVLTVMAIPGQIDVVPTADAHDTDPGGVPQIYESWTATLTRV